jgi:hypothetical protein
MQYKLPRDAEKEGVLPSIADAELQPRLDVCAGWRATNYLYYPTRRKEPTATSDPEKAMASAPGTEYWLP